MAPQGIRSESCVKQGFENSSTAKTEDCRLLLEARTTEVTWTAELPEKFENAIFGGIFQIPAIE